MMDDGEDYTTDDRRAQRIWQQRDKRSPRERGMVRDTLERKLREVGLHDDPDIRKELLQPVYYVASDRWRPPRVRTLSDVDREVEDILTYRRWKASQDMPPHSVQD